jgi:disulfide bond formation protein DsbB
MASAAEMLVDNLRGKLDGQIDALESARTRAAVALSVSGVIAGLFGPNLLTTRGNLALAAIASLVVSAGPAIYVLVPHKLTLWPEGEGWRAWLDAYGKWATENQQPDDSEALLQSQALNDMAKWYNANKPVLNNVQWAMAISFAGVVLQLVFWAMAAFVR